MFLAVPRCFEINTDYESPYQIVKFRCGTMIRGTRLKRRGEGGGGRGGGVVYHCFESHLDP